MEFWRVVALMLSLSLSSRCRCRDGLVVWLCIVVMLYGCQVV